MSSQGISSKSGELAGQAQMKKDQIVGQASDACHSASQQASEDQAGDLLQQKGEQMMNIAQEAADAVKNALGLDNNNDNTITTTNNNNRNSI